MSNGAVTLCRDDPLCLCISEAWGIYAEKQVISNQQGSFSPSPCLWVGSPTAYLAGSGSASHAVHLWPGCIIWRPSQGGRTCFHARSLSQQASRAGCWHGSSPSPRERASQGVLTSWPWRPRVEQPQRERESCSAFVMEPREPHTAFFTVFHWSPRPVQFSWGRGGHGRFLGLQSDQEARAAAG